MSNSGLNYAVFILSHGRADNVVTYKTLRRQGYTGDVRIIIDDEDNQEEQYREIYGDMVVKFNKQKYIDQTDTMDCTANRKVVVFARNACFDIARELGYDYHIQLDDDYNEFLIRYASGQKLMSKRIADLNKWFDEMVLFVRDTGSTTLCIAQGGDMIGGVSGFFKKGLSRKAMNSFVFKTDRDNPPFIGRLNDDVNYYAYYDQLGYKIFTFSKAQITQPLTQTKKGGATDIYLEFGTYLKSFYSVMLSPSCVQVSIIGTANKRIHHRVNWQNCAPMILNEKYRKDGMRAV